MLANLKPLSLFKEGFRNRISIASLMQRLNVLLSVARTFVLLESTECPVSWQCSWTADEKESRNEKRGGGGCGVGWWMVLPRIKVLQNFSGIVNVSQSHFLSDSLVLRSLIFSKTALKSWFFSPLPSKALDLFAKLPRVLTFQRRL